MNGSVHEQARQMIAAGVDGFSEEQRTWLRTHLEECIACRRYADAARQVVRALRSQPVSADAALVQMTRERLRARGLELQRQRGRLWLVCSSCLAVGISAAITSVVLWRALEWMGDWAGVSSWLWQAIFAVFGVGPALVISGLLVIHGTHLSNNGEEQWM